MTVLPFFENLDFLGFHNMHVFHCYDLEKKTINTNTFFSIICVFLLLLVLLYIYIYFVYSHFTFVICFQIFLF